MPVFAFLAVVGFAVIALLFDWDATLERVSPEKVTSDLRRTSTSTQHDIASGTSAQVST